MLGVEVHCARFGDRLVLVNKAELTNSLLLMRSLRLAPLRESDFLA